MILLITNPLNSLVPVYDKVYKRMGIDAGRKIIGLTILDTIRSATFIGEYLGILLISVPFLSSVDTREPPLFHCFLNYSLATYRKSTSRVSRSVFSMPETRW